MAHFPAVDRVRRLSRLPVGSWMGALGATALLLAVSPRYGFHRDELYFVVAGRRPDWGYIDQPPLTPLLARVSETLFGTSPTALRILPAIAVGAVTLLAASMARRFGAGRGAQVFAAVSTGFTGVLLGVGHLLSTAVFDFLFWTVCLWLLVMILDGGDRRLWLAVGLVVGVGLQNKHTIAFLAIAILFGLAVTDRREELRSPWPWAGAAIAAVVALPNIIWQGANGWPQLEMAAALQERSEGALSFVLNQPLLLSIAMAIPAAAGLWWLLRSKETARWRPIPIAYLFLAVLFAATGAKPYYLAPMYSGLLAAGAAWSDRRSVRGQRRVGVGIGVGILVGAFIALPIMPVERAGTFDFTGELGETVGWPALVDQIGLAHSSIPADSRTETIVFTDAYGEAGAVDVLGPDSGLPPAATGHNNYWLWGPPETHGPVIGVGDVDEVLEPICPDIRQVGTIDNPYDVENETLGKALWLCLEPQGQLSDIWDSVRHYN